MPYNYFFVFFERENILTTGNSPLVLPRFDAGSGSAQTESTFLSNLLNTGNWTFEIFSLKV